MDSTLFLNLKPGRAHNMERCEMLGTQAAARLHAPEVIHSMQTDGARGLTMGQVQDRSVMHAKNELAQQEEETLLMKFLETFKDPLILLLLASAVVSVLVGQYDDAISICMAVTIVGTVAFVQEYRSEQSLAALNKLVPPHCTVLRDGVACDMMAADLVPGDVVMINAGDRIPADCRLLESNDLEIDDSSLTGEDHPHHKVRLDATSVLSDSANLPLAELSNMLFMGSLCCSGNGKAVVTSTGMGTEFGKVFADLQEVENRRTPLQLKMDDLGKQLSILSFGIIGVITLVGLARGQPLLGMFSIGVSLAVAAIPEGLPICVTVTLALGVMRMAKRNAIVKKLPAVEALGCATVVCVDKTGTVTQNKMTVTEIVTAYEHEPIDVALRRNGLNGSNSNGSRGAEAWNRVLEGPDRGKFTLKGREIGPADHPAVTQALTAGWLCNNAHIEEDPSEPGKILKRGQPTELALVVAGEKWGISDPRLTTRRTNEVTFNSERKRMEVTCNTGASNGSERVTRSSAAAASCHYVKGTLESILFLCTTYADRNGKAVPLTSQVEAHLSKAAVFLGRKGRRVIAMAYGAVMNELCFGALVGIVDPPRLGSVDAVEEMQRCKTRLCMITGDAEETAVAIASQVGFYDPLFHRALSGPEMERLSTVELEAIIHDVAVFYRTTPRHKLVIVRALQAIGEVVSMTGDGVNDAPALKAADIGVAMGSSGTDVAKEAADMILVDDDFGTIIAAIEEGKGIFYNIKNFLTFQLSTSVAALSIVAVATFCGLPAPLNAMQILWINIIMDGPPAQSLGVEPVDDVVVRRPPRRPHDPIITQHLLFRVLSSALFIVVGTLWVFWTEMQDGEVINLFFVTRRTTTMTFTTFVMFDMMNALCCRSADRPVYSMNLLSNRPFCYAVGGSILAQMFVVYFPPLQEVFQTESLNWGDLLKVLLIASSIAVLDSVRKGVQPTPWQEESGGPGHLQPGYGLGRILSEGSTSNTWQLPEMDTFLKLGGGKEKEADRMA
ncbi:unnamed protein product [Chrysoparadoxa australica]